MTETNSICHQGVYNVTDSFANTLWLLDRLGIMARRGTELMARQSLIGYNYSLLGNFPAEPIRASPDYSATVLFRRLVGGTGNRADVSAVLNVSRFHPAKVAAHAFCARGRPGGVVVVLVNLDAAVTSAVTVTGPTGRWEQYTLSPAWTDSDSASPAEKTTAHGLMLNNIELVVGPGYQLPAFPPAMHPPPLTGTAAVMDIEPLTAVLAVFPAAGARACQDHEAKYLQ